MPSPEQERMEALTEAIARLLRRQQETDRRLARIEASLGLERAPAPAPPFIEPRPSEPQAPIEPPRFLGGPPPPPSTQPELETRMGLTWINRVGVITLVLGVIFFFKYAVERHWIGETTRVALGAAAGIAALWLGDRIWRGGQKIYAQGISGAGIALLFVTFYAGFALYHLFAQQVAFLLMALTTLAAGGLALRYDAAAMAALGLFGGYITPLLLSTGEDRPWFLFSYVLLLDVGASFLAQKRRWRGLEALAFGATVLLYASQLRFPVRPERQFVDTVFALAYYALFVTREFRVISIGAQVLAGLTLGTVLTPSLAPFPPIALAVLLAGLAIADRRGWNFSVSASLASFWFCYGVWYPAAARPLSAVFPLLAIVFLVLLGWTWRRNRVEDLIVTALNGIVYFTVGYFLLAPHHHPYTGLFALAVAGAHMALAWLLWKRDRRAALLPAGLASVFLILAAPVQFTGYRITVAWSLEAAALAWIGTRMRQRLATSASLAVFALVLLRLELFDVRASPRFFTFAVAAAAMWAAAYWIRAGWTALATYVAGHFVMLWVLSLEVIEWARRHALPENARSMASMFEAILMAAYALMLVSIGVAAQSGINRILGLGLIALVVAKLYVYDVWYLGLLYRMVAFAILGVLLLVMSYLYSHFRGSIESWWRKP